MTNKKAPKWTLTVRSYWSHSAFYQAHVDTLGMGDINLPDRRQSKLLHSALASGRTALPATTKWRHRPPPQRKKPS